MNTLLVLFLVFVCLLMYFVVLDWYDALVTKFKKGNKK